MSPARSGAANQSETMVSPPAATAEEAATRPVWALLGHKAGDNHQVLALAESLGVGFETRHLRYRPTELASNLLLGPNLHGIRADSRAALRPPWPGLVITAGRRNEPVARWIRARADHPVRLVHVGRPWADPADYDLIVTTPQYALGGRDNVIEVELPLRRTVAAADAAAAVAAWETRLAGLPRPWIAVLVGGTSGMYQLDGTKAARLAAAAQRLAIELGGSLLITTSPRTPRGAAATIRAQLSVPHHFFEWRPDAPDNPYAAFLALADRLIVTGESASMLAEACATRRPVYIFDMRDRGERGPRARLQALRNALRYRAWTHHLAQRFAPRRMRRDVGRMHAALIGAGRAVWLGETFPDREPPPVPGFEEVTRRVRTLLPTDDRVSATP
jgi:mitochondrial fission protein ELM1